MAARMQLDVLVGGTDGVGVFVGLIIAERTHQHGAARPHRIRMLALHLVELLGGFLPAVRFDLGPAGIVDLFDRPLDVIGILVVAGTVVEAEPGTAREQEGPGQRGEKPARDCFPYISIRKRCLVKAHVCLILRDTDALRASRRPYAIALSSRSSPSITS